jgi:hypothetical protein
MGVRDLAGSLSRLTELGLLKDGAVSSVVIKEAAGDKPTDLIRAYQAATRASGRQTQMSKAAEVARSLVDMGVTPEILSTAVTAYLQEYRKNDKWFRITQCAEAVAYWRSKSVISIGSSNNEPVIFVGDKEGGWLR